MIYLIVFISALIGLMLSRRFALAIDLMDKPNQRKLHQGHIPLVGGISLWFALSVLWLLEPQWLPFQQNFWLAISLLLIVGVLDDKFNLAVFPRFLAQGAAALIMMISGLVLTSFGELWPGVVIHLGPLGYPLTLLAICASINAFNMIDGIDGLLGTVTCATFGGLATLFFLQGSCQLGSWCLALVLSMLPYLVANLDLLKRKNGKVFMGDAGSTVIGFAAIWMLVFASQHQPQAMAPVTALWLIAVPLIDMCAVSLRRIVEGHSPFRPDRGHVHHILMKCGLSSRQSLALLAGIAFSGVIIGVLFESMDVPDCISLLMFLLCFLAWLVFSIRVYRR